MHQSEVLSHGGDGAHIKFTATSFKKLRDDLGLTRRPEEEGWENAGSWLGRKMTSQNDVIT